MKKLFSVLTALVPLFYIMTCVFLFYLDAEDVVTISAILGSIVLALIICAVYSSFRHKAESSFLAKMNLWIIGVNLLVFLALIVVMVITIIDVRIAEQQGAMEGGMAIVVLWLLTLPIRINYFFCRITAALCASQALDNTFYNRFKTLHFVLHLFPVLDMISAVLVYSKVKHCQTFQQPTIETE